MKKYTLLQIFFIINICLQTIFIKTAEESKSTERPMLSRDEEINDYIKRYPHLQEGFDILQNIDTKRPNFYVFLDTNVNDSNDEDQEPNIGNVIQEAEDIISREMRAQFLHIFQSVDHSNFNTTENPVFQYAMHYRNNFMNSIIHEWVDLDENKYARIFSESINHNDITLAKLLLDMGLNPNSKPTYESLLSRAIISKRSIITGLLLAAGAKNDIIIRGYDGHNWETLLTYAIKENDIATAIELLKYKINPDKQNAYGKTPLFIATEKNNPEIVHLLLTAHANPDIADTLQDQHLVDPNDYSVNPGESPFLRRSYHVHFENNAHNNKFASSLPNFNDTPERDTYGSTSLQIAAEKNYREIAHMLITAGANLNISNIFNGTALQIATRKNHEDIKNMLITAGALQYIPMPRPARQYNSRETTFLFNNMDTFTAPHDFSLVQPFQADSIIVSDNVITESQADFLNSGWADLNWFNIVQDIQANPTIKNNDIIVEKDYQVAPTVTQPRRSERIKRKLELATQDTIAKKYSK